MSDYVNKGMPVKDANGVTRYVNRGVPNNFNASGGGLDPADRDKLDNTPDNTNEELSLKESIQNKDVQFGYLGANENAKLAFNKQEPFALRVKNTDNKTITAKTCIMISNVVNSTDIIYTNDEVEVKRHIGLPMTFKVLKDGVWYYPQKRVNHAELCIWVTDENDATFSSTNTAGGNNILNWKFGNGIYNNQGRLIFRDNLNSPLQIHQNPTRAKIGPSIRTINNLVGNEWNITNTDVTDFEDFQMVIKVTYNTVDVKISDGSKVHGIVLDDIEVGEIGKAYINHTINFDTSSMKIGDFIYSDANGQLTNISMGQLPIGGVYQVAPLQILGNYEETSGMIYFDIRPLVLLGVLNDKITHILENAIIRKSALPDNTDPFTIEEKGIYPCNTTINVAGTNYRIFEFTCNRFFDEWIIEYICRGYDTLNLPSKIFSITKDKVNNKVVFQEIPLPIIEEIPLPRENAKLNKITIEEFLKQTKVRKKETLK